MDVDRYREKRDILCQGLSSIGYEFVKPQGTFYLFPKSPTEDDMQIVDALRRERILTVPGRGFSYPGHFRIAYCVEDEVIRRSLEGFAKAYNAVTS